MLGEKVVRYDKKTRQHVLSSARGGTNTILVRYTFAQPVVCGLDAYIKDTCLHRTQPKAGTVCHNCQQCNHCAPSLAASNGGVIGFTPSVVNAARRAEREAHFKAKQKKRAAMRANQRNMRYHKRAVAKRAH